MRKVILQIQLKPSEASIKGVRRKLGLKAAQIDRDFGVPVVRPDQELYAVRVDVDVAQRLRGDEGRTPAPAASGDVRVALVH